MENLWPKIESDEIKTPSTVLIEQGKHLEKMTDGILSYQIETTVIDGSQTESGKSARTEFYIHAPLLGDYKFLLLYISHDFIFSYPVKMGDFVDDGRYAYEDMDDEKIFLQNLGELFNRKDTQKMIQNLYGRSKGSQK